MLVACCLSTACRCDRAPAAATQPAAATPNAIVADQPSPQPCAELNSAMTAFSGALRARDTQGFLNAFSQTQTWNALNTKSDGSPPARVSYERLAQALDSEGELRESLFGEKETSLRSYVSGVHETPWAAQSEFQFVPPGASRGLVWIAWRHEDERWVVDTIAWPLR